MDTPITFDQFRDECNRFRNLITDKRNSLRLMERAYGALFMIVTRLDPKMPPEQKATAVGWWEMLSREWPIRQSMMAMAGHPLYNNEAERQRDEEWNSRLP